MHPVLLRLGSFDVTSFGALVGVGALVGIRVFGHELACRHLSARAVNAAVGGIVAGLAGAKLLWVIEHLGEDTFSVLLLSRGGLSWFGGLAGGVGVGMLLLRLADMPLLPVLAAATPALAIGQAIGRVGCFFVGDDYGRPTDLPWGVAFPQGSPPIDVHVHPTQLYDAVLLAALSYTLATWRSRGTADRDIVARYLLLVGLFRFGIEFVRINTRVLGPFTIAHIAAAAAIVTGVAMMALRGDHATMRLAKRAIG